MADVKFSGIGVVAMSGSVGNQTFSRNKYGMYSKNRIGAPAGSIHLSAWQSVVAALQNIWINIMTEHERQSWYIVSLPSEDSISDTHLISGYYLYMQLNLNAFIGFGINIITPPELPPSITCPPFQIATLNSTTVILTCAGGIASQFAIYVTGNLSPGRMSNTQIWTHLHGSSGGTGPFDISTAYILRIGAPVPGKKIFFKIVPISAVSFRRGYPFILSGIVS